MLWRFTWTQSRLRILVPRSPVYPETNRPCRPLSGNLPNPDIMKPWEIVCRLASLSGLATTRVIDASRNMAGLKRVVVRYLSALRGTVGKLVLMSRLLFGESFLFLLYKALLGAKRDIFLRNIWLLMSRALITIRCNQDIAEIRHSSCWEQRVYGFGIVRC